MVNFTTANQGRVSEITRRVQPLFHRKFHFIKAQDQSRKICVKSDYEFFRSKASFKGI